jgi:thiol:disulfide interchange protein
MRLVTPLALSVLLCSGQLIAQRRQPDTAKSSNVVELGYEPVHSFDPKRNAESDIQAAIAEAQRTGKRILLDIGGDWCQYCHQMDDFFRLHPDLLQLRDSNFLTVAIYYGDDNKNKQALSRYSKLLGIPHFFVLEKDGTLLYSQHVLDLREGGSYDANKMKRFLLAWAPSSTPAKP